MILLQVRHVGAIYVCGASLCVVVTLLISADRYTTVHMSRPPSSQQQRRRLPELSKHRWSNTTQQPTQLSISTPLHPQHSPNDHDTLITTLPKPVSALSPPAHEQNGSQGTGSTASADDTAPNRFSNAINAPGSIQTTETTPNYKAPPPSTPLASLSANLHPSPSPSGLTHHSTNLAETPPSHPQTSSSREHETQALIHQAVLVLTARADTGLNQVVVNEPTPDNTTFERSTLRVDGTQNTSTDNTQRQGVQSSTGVIPSVQPVRDGVSYAEDLSGTGYMSVKVAHTPWGFPRDGWKDLMPVHDLDAHYAPYDYDAYMASPLSWTQVYSRVQPLLVDIFISGRVQVSTMLDGVAMPHTAFWPAYAWVKRKKGTLEPVFPFSPIYGLVHLNNY